MVWTGLRDQTQERCAPHRVMPQLARPLLACISVFTWTMSPFHSLFPLSHENLWVPLLTKPCLVAAAASPGHCQVSILRGSVSVPPEPAPLACYSHSRVLALPSHSPPGPDSHHCAAATVPCSVHGPRVVWTAAPKQPGRRRFSRSLVRLAGMAGAAQHLRLWEDAMLPCASRVCHAVLPLSAQTHPRPRDPAPHSPC